MKIRVTLVLTLAIAFTTFAEEKPGPDSTRKEDIIYGRSYGTALTMDVFQPKQNSNHRGIILMVSGGWVSAKESINAPLFQTFFQTPLKRGYTIFCVVHGANPKYSIPEILPMVNRAVRFIRYHAKDYDVDPDHLGILGGSAGGHLSCMQGVNPAPPDPKSPDPIDRVSSKVQAVVAFFPPTDFLNYGAPGVKQFGTGTLTFVGGAFDFRQLDTQTFKLERIMDPTKRDEIGRQISPIYFVTPDDPPTMILQGDKDPLVPLQQAETFLKKLDEAKVPNKLILKPGASHGWANIDKDMVDVTDWFDQYLLDKKPTTRATTQP
jgi:acetyl esterase/lipase